METLRKFVADGVTISNRAEIKNAVVVHYKNNTC